MPGGKKIILGVTGSIAAYKAVFLLRLLKKAGAEVQVVTSPSVQHFVGDLSFAALSGKPVFSGLWSANWSEHVSIGTWADLMLIAPATANTIGKLANGICDNALTAVYLAARCPVWIAPAMDADMFIHPSTRENLNKLASFGNRILPTGAGFLASGLEGPGRLLEPEEIFAEIDVFFGPKPLSGKKLLLTAGPTQEAIDPVRYISNHSSGKMGYAIAEKARDLGAQVTLISGPTSIPNPPGITTIRVRSADQMLAEVLAVSKEQDIMIMSAAVVDYAPATVSDTKIKKKDAEFTLELRKTADILKTVGQNKLPGQFLAGFALETDHAEEHAKQKLASKNLDMIVLNSLQDEGAGFGHDTNKITIFDKNDGIERYPLKSKSEVASDILEKIIQLNQK
jgi:phosphopantothenoylcysteine decarboxylase/phosphopantothenate--cysteine ligase